MLESVRGVCLGVEKTLATANTTTMTPWTMTDDVDGSTAVSRLPPETLRFQDVKTAPQELFPYNPFVVLALVLKNMCTLVCCGGSALELAHSC